MIGGAGVAAYRAGKRSQAGQDQEAEQDARIDELEEQQGAGDGQAPAAAAAPAAAPAAQDTAVQRVDALTKLKGLLDAGVLTPEEFDAQKKQLLGGG